MIPTCLPNAQRGSMPLVLVVEDEALIAMELQDQLLHLGFCVLGPAVSIAAALRLLAADHPDIAILDYNLRGEAVTPVAIKLMSLDIPFLLSTANERSAIVDPVFTGIANLGKPVAPAELYKALGALMHTPL